jgi:long-subunit acyl-CoA synthetase (AMP-forming)
MDGCLEWNDFMKRSSLVPKEEVRRRASDVKPDDVCNMQYTSGTTGFPKGVMLTHRNIVNNGKIIGDRMDTDIVAGLESEIDSVLVLSGVSNMDTVSKFSYRPTYILKDVGDIVE